MRWARPSRGSFPDRIWLGSRTGVYFEVMLCAHPLIRLSEEEPLGSKLGAVAEASYSRLPSSLC